MNRREFRRTWTADSLAIAAKPLFAAAQTPTRSGVFPASVRADFPSVSARDLPELRGDASARHVRRRCHRSRSSTTACTAPGEGRADFGAAKQEELKKKFGALINATANEIAYTANTSDGENIVVMGLDLRARRGGNIVIDELHFTTSLYMYKELEKKGVELRIVKHRNWAIDPEDMDKAIDKNTRLVSMALVSNVNGFMHDAKAVSAIAHARGALRVRRHHPGGGRGAGRREGARHRLRLGRHLQVADGRTRHRLPLRPRGSAGHGAADDEIRAPAGVELQPRGADVGAAARRGALRDRRHPGAAGRVRERRHRLRATSSASTNIRAHAKQLTDRLQKELPPLGYKPLTPIGHRDADRSRSS